METRVADLHMTSKGVLAEPFAQFLQGRCVVGAGLLHLPLNQDVAAQQPHLRPFVYVVGEVTIVTVDERL